MRNQTTKQIMPSASNTRSSTNINKKNNANLTKHNSSFFNFASSSMPQVLGGGSKRQGNDASHRSPVLPSLHLRSPGKDRTGPKHNNSASPAALPFTSSSHYYSPKMGGDRDKNDTSSKDRYTSRSQGVDSNRTGGRLAAGANSSGRHFDMLTSYPRSASPVGLYSFDDQNAAANDSDVDVQVMERLGIHQAARPPATPGLDLPMAANNPDGGTPRRYPKNSVIAQSLRNSSNNFSSSANQSGSPITQASPDMGTASHYRTAYHLPRVNFAKSGVVGKKLYGKGWNKPPITTQYPSTGVFMNGYTSGTGAVGGAFAGDQSKIMRFLHSLFCCLTLRRRAAMLSGGGRGRPTRGPQENSARQFGAQPMFASGDEKDYSAVGGGGGGYYGAGTTVTDSAGTKQGFAVNGHGVHVNAFVPKPTDKLLLPAIRPTDSVHQKNCLIVDLDETLVHSSFKPVQNPDFIIPVEIDGVVHQVYVLKRPYTDEFLQRIASLFECVLFTASLAKYADPVADLLDQWGVFRTRLFREHCVYNKGNYVKDLNRLGRDLRRVVILDNSPASFAWHPENAVPVQSWFDDAQDTELMDMLPFLERLAESSNVYDILRNTGGLEGGSGRDRTEDGLLHDMASR